MEFKNNNKAEVLGSFLQCLSKYPFMERVVWLLATNASHVHSKRKKKNLINKVAKNQNGFTLSIVTFTFGIVFLHGPAPEHTTEYSLLFSVLSYSYKTKMKSTRTHVMASLYFTGCRHAVKRYFKFSLNFQKTEIDGLTMNYNMHLQMEKCQKARQTQLWKTADKWVWMWLCAWTGC